MDINFFKEIKEKFDFLNKKVIDFSARVSKKGETIIGTKLFFGTISLLLSVLLWAFVAWNGNSDISRGMTIRVQYSDPPRGYSAFEQTVNVTVRLSGRVNILSRLEQSDIRAHVNLAGLQPGKYSLPITIDTPPYVRARAWDPVMASVEIYRHVERTVPVAYKLTGTLPQGISIASIDISPPEVIISGPETDVLELQRAEAPLRADKIKNGVPVRVAVQFPEKYSETEGRVTAAPREVKVTPHLEREITAKNIPVTVELTGLPQEGMEVESIKILPESVRVSGKSSTVKEMTRVALPPIDISGLDQSLHIVVPLQPASDDKDITLTGPDRARIDVTLRHKMTSRTYHGIGVMTENGAKDKEWKISPETVSVTIEGTQLAMNDLKGSDPPFELYVDLSNVVAQRITLPVLVRNLKKDFQIIKTEPEQVTVTAVN